MTINTQIQNKAYLIFFKKAQKLLSSSFVRIYYILYSIEHTHQHAAITRKVLRAAPALIIFGMTGWAD